MKKFLLLLCVFMLALPLTVQAAVVESPDFNLVLNGDEVAMDPSMPVVISNDMTLVPLKLIFDTINRDGTATMDWDETQREVRLTYGQTRVSLWIDNPTALVNDVETAIEGPAPIIYRDRTYVPLRFLSNVFDLSVHWVDATRTAYLMENELLDRIVSLAETSVKFPEDSKISMDIVMDVSMGIDAGVGVQTTAMKMQGTLKQDMANRFQHVIITSDEITAETYDNGEHMYMVSGDEVMRIQSAFTLADSIMAQYDVLAGLNIPRELYSTLKLNDSDGNYAISGNIYLPTEYFGELLSNLDLEGLPQGIDIEVSKPFYYNISVDKETGFLTAMDINYGMKMALESEGIPVSMDMEYDVKLFNIDTDAQFDSVIPQWIIERAGDSE